MDGMLQSLLTPNRKDKLRFPYHQGLYVNRI